MTSSKTKTFEDWFNELEGYALLGERFYSDVDLVIDGISNQDLMVRWLKAAYEAGYSAGAASGRARINIVDSLGKIE